MNYKVSYKVANKMTTPPLSAVSLDNEIGVRFDKFIDKRVTGEFAINEIR